MLCNLNNRKRVSKGAAFIPVLLLILAVTGCGKDKETGEKVTKWTPQKTVPTSRVELPPPEMEIASTAKDPADEETTVVAVEPEHPEEITYEEAEVAYRERRYKDAVRLFTSYTDRKGENPWGFYMLGLSAWKAGDHEVAEKAFKRALELDPDHVKSRLNLSRVLLDTGRTNEALVETRKVLQIDPESNVAFRLQGRALYRSGEVEKAIEAYWQAILIDDQDAWSMNNLGMIFIENQRFSDALPPLARAVELRDDVAIFQNNLGMALERTGHFREAEELYRSATTVDGSNEKALENLTRIEDVVEEAGIEPLDLGALALNFIDEIEGWRVDLAGGASTDVLEPVTAISEADSIDSSLE